MSLLCCRRLACANGESYVPHMNTIACSCLPYKRWSHPPCRDGLAYGRIFTWKVHDDAHPGEEVFRDWRVCRAHG